MGNSFCIAPFVEGCGTGAGLIIAIGAQNAFVLKQGILKNHVMTIVLLCFFLDACLIGIGVAGFGTLLATNKLLLSTARWGGALFLFYYGFRSFLAVFKSESLKFEIMSGRLNWKMTVVTVLILTLLNPHAYLVEPEVFSIR